METDTITSIAEDPALAGQGGGQVACLKELRLLGYKSFAARTGFSFGPGITAIVGPNGSGKSNIADAIRWVLGEQSLRLLRGRRTEDMIFSGSEIRSRLGMAEASLTLDNENGWLPIDYTEVTITRRAYRSGDNEYLLNGSRVRLRDVHDLLGRSGLRRRTYTVIGQGLVDTALSLRPEERRILIEDAAGLSGYQDRRRTTLSRLEATQANLVRTQDILQEIAPRLRRRKRQAGRAEEHTHLSGELIRLLRISYGYRWRQAQQALRLTHKRQAEARTEWEQALAAAEKLEQESAEVRLRLQTLRQALGEWHRESSLLHTDLEQAQRESAVLREREEQIGRQAEENQKEIQSLGRTRQARLERAADLRQEIEALDGRRHQQHTLVKQAEEELQQRQAEQTQLHAQVLSHSQQITATRNQQQQHRQDLARLDSQVTHWSQEVQQHQETALDLEGRERVFSEKAQTLEKRGEELLVRRADLIREQERLDGQLAALRDQIAKGHSRLSALQAQHDRLAQRLEDLRRERQEMAGFFPGVRAVLRAGASEPDRPLPGVVGTVASQIRVPDELETAIEAALGTRLQDVIVQGWGDAEKAIAFLKESQAGRATFLPLDSLHPQQPIRYPAMPGVLGLASDLVWAEKAVTPAVHLLLNRTIVVEDLAAAQALFGRLRGEFQIITTQGEIIHSSGAVTGGSKRTKGKGLLAREAEWRRLPGELEDLRQVMESAGQDLDHLQEEQDTTLAEASTTEEEIRHLDRTTQALQGQLGDQQTQIQALERERSWHLTQSQKLKAQIQQQDASRQEIERALQAAGDRLAKLETRLAEFQAGRSEESLLELNRKLSFLQAQVQVIESDRSAATRILDTLAQEVEALDTNLAGRESRAESLRQEMDQLRQRLATLRTHEESLSPQLQRLQDQITPTEQQVRDLDDLLLGSSGHEREVRRSLRVKEERLSQVTLDAQRHEDRLQHLREQIERDLGLVEVEPANGMPEQRPLPLRSLTSSLPTVDEPPEDLEEEIRRLRGQVARLGAINPEATSEYQDLRERYEFLESQSQDLQEAAEDLHEVISELDHLMEIEFKSTFDAVNEEFKTFFQRLFGGGAARLVLTDPDDLIRTGIEIVARPPGKRQQTLAALSGGERALTAVALIFAILQTCPTPFCVLDEVDAMLDEANVGRFREALVDLSQKTQFIVISHSRKTIEAAHRLYGISMRRDGSSQVVSVRIDEDEADTAEAAA